jgi:cell division transport system permease protein
MKSVGATNSFVRLPFVVEGIIIGVLSSVLSLGVVYGVYEFAINQFSDLFRTMGIVPLDFMNYAWYMLAAFLIIGVVSGVFGSLITMRRYLNKEGSEISAL